MTDNEIKKALEHCTNNGDCKKCTINPHKGNYGFCTSLAIKAALELINRLEADKEALIAGQETLQKSLAEKNAEIERLQKENFDLKNGYFQKRYEESECKELQSVRKAWEKSRMDYINLNAEWEGKYISAKSEAIKEFAERLKKLSRNLYPFSDEPIIDCKDVDNLVKEMVGDAV